MIKEGSWDRSAITALIEANDHAVERAILAIYARQTHDEKAVSTSKHLNGRGFAASHASKGSYYARWIMSGRRLTGYHLQRARTIALRYAGQLAIVANEGGHHGKQGDQTV